MLCLESGRNSSPGDYFSMGKMSCVQLSRNQASKLILTAACHLSVWCTKTSMES